MITATSPARSPARAEPRPRKKRDIFNNQPRTEAVESGRPPEEAISVWFPPLGAWGWEGPVGVVGRHSRSNSPCRFSKLLRFADLLPHPGFIQPRCAQAGARRPEMQTTHPTHMLQLPRDPHSALPNPGSRGQTSRRRWNAQAQAHVVGHRMPFRSIPYHWDDTDPAGWARSAASAFRRRPSGGISV